MNKLDKLNPDDPKVIELFAKHCFEGWSVNTFSIYLQGGTVAYRYLKENNPQFKELHFKHKKKQGKWIKS